jgi:dihydrofolate synthase/folylpolyglutamate synthase
MTPALTPADASARLTDALAPLDALVDWERRERGGPAGMRVDLGPALDLCARLGEPQRRLRCVHVTGSKGKGSTTSLIERGLLRAGLRVGAYFSPHVERIHERMRIDGAWIGDEALAEALTQAEEARRAACAAGSAARNATWFDVLTAAALWHFARAGCEWAAVEVGLGGRLDSTNVVRGEVCVITNIELEHTAVLGPTRAHIAREKAGILKTGSTLVTLVEPGCAPWSDEAGAVLEQHAAARGAALVRPAPRAWSRFAERNAALAALALDELGRRGLTTRVPLARELASRPPAGLAPCAPAGTPVGGWLLGEEQVRAARLPGRVELFEARGRRVVLDGAHVPASLSALLAELAGWPELAGQRPLVVLGMGKDKDEHGLLKALRGSADRLLCTSLGEGPYREAEALCAAALAAGFAAEVVRPPAAALECALEQAPRGGWVLVTGSLHLVGALRGRLAKDASCSPSSPICS